MKRPSLERFRSLRSPCFLLALFLLLVNDLYLKGAFHNALTGKLSDFAGLFVFALFWMTFFPRFQKAVIFSTTLLFILWKSPLSEGFIELWNELSLLPVERVVDMSDLWALSVLPLAHFHESFRQIGELRLSPAVPLLLSAFAFMATSYRSKVDHRADYGFAYSRDSLLTTLHRSEWHLHSPVFWERRPSDTADAIYVHRYRKDSVSLQRFKKYHKHQVENQGDTLTLSLMDTAMGAFRAEFLVEGDGDSSWIRLFGFRYQAPRDTAFENRAPNIFEGTVVESLRSRQQ